MNIYSGTTSTPGRASSLRVSISSWIPQRQSGSDELSDGRK